MATLSGNKIKNTYQSLVKFSDNGNITTSAKQLTDGFGNNSPMFVSTTQVGIGVTPESGLNLHVFGDAKIGSNLTVIGNLVVEGSTTTVGTDTLTVKDPLIVLANNNTSTDAVDIGFYGKYTPAGTTLYSGIFREALTGKYRLFKGLEVEPTTTVNTSGTGYAKADLIIGALEATTGDFSGDVDIDGSLDVDDVISVEGSAFGRIEIGGASGGYIDLKAPNSDDYDFRIITSSGGNELTTATGDLIFNTAETLALTLDTSQNATFEGEIILKDNKKAIFGAGSDLEIYHTGSHSYISNDTGNFEITTTGSLILQNASSNKWMMTNQGGSVLLYYNGVSKLTTTSTGVTVTGIVESDGLNVVDNGKAIFGTGSDLQIYHDGVDSFIKELGVGALKITSNQTLFYNVGYVKLLAEFDDIGVKLYYDNVKKFETTSTGVSVTGKISNVTNPSAAQDAATKSYVDSQVSANNELSEVLSNGNTTGGTNIAVSAGDDITFTDTSKAIFGAGSDLEIFHDGTNSFIIDQGTGDLNITSDGASINLQKGNSEYLARFLPDSAVELYYDGSKKLETTSTGIYVTGSGVFTQDLWINTSQKLFFDNGGDCYISEDTTGRLKFVVDGSEFMRLGDGIPDTITFYKDSTFAGDLTVGTDSLFVDVSTDSVGIGLTNPSAYSVDTLVINTPDEKGITLVSSSTEKAYIAFQDGTGALENFMSFDHAVKKMNFNVFDTGGDINFTIGEGVTKFNIDNTNVRVYDDLTVDGNSTFSGNVAIQSTIPKLSFTDLQQDDWDIINDNGEFKFLCSTGSGVALQLNTNNNATFAGNVGVGFAAQSNIRTFVYDNSANYSLAVQQDGSGIPFQVTSGGSVRMIVANSGNVGIGLTDTSSVKLGVSGNSGLPATSGTTQTGLLRLKASNNATLDMGCDHTTAQGWLQVTDVASLSTEYNLLLQPNGGNVGISNDSPNTGKLVVEGDNFVVTNSGQSIGGIDLRTAANGGAGSYSAGISFGGASSGRAAISGVMSQASTDGDRQGLAFFTHSSGTGSADAEERMRIDSSGLVEIKTQHQL